MVGLKVHTGSEGKMMGLVEGVLIGTEDVAGNTVVGRSGLGELVGARTCGVGLELGIRIPSP